MKKVLFATALLASSIFSAPAVFAQEGSAASATYSSTADSTPAPAPAPVIEKTDVNVNMPAPEVVQAPAPDVNVHVDSPAASVPSTSTEKTTKETSVTRVVETPAPDNSSNMAFLLVGGGIAALAVAGLYASSRK